MIKHLQTAVNKFIRLIFGLNGRDSVKDVMQKHGIFSINQLEVLETASFMYKYLHGDLVETFQNLLDDNFLDGSNSCQTRSQSKLSLAFAESNKQNSRWNIVARWLGIPFQHPNGKLNRTIHLKKR